MASARRWRIVRPETAPARTGRRCSSTAEPDHGQLNLQVPLFATYVIAASLMILKAVGMSWLTVVRMMQAKGAFDRRRT